MFKFTILTDSREKKGYTFRNYPVHTVEKKLKTADYCIKGDGEEVIGDNGASFDPNYGVERKNPNDFTKSITWERDRYENELARADSFVSRMPVVIERNKQYFKDEEYYQDVHPNSILGTIDTHPDVYNMDYFFNDTRKSAEQLTYEFLNWRWEQING